MISDADFIKLLETHDWYFEQSDDSRTYARGLQSQNKLLYLCQEQPELFRLYNHASNCIIRSLPFDFPSVVGTTPVKDETKQHNTHTNANTPMSQELIRIIRAAALAVLNECDALSSAPPPTTPPPAAEKPAKAPKASKPAPAPAPEPEPEPEVPAISEARLVATVKTLPKEGKIALKEYFQKTFGYNTMAEIEEVNRNAIHAKAVKLGAADTDPEADEVEGM